jgi:hypothetical protein
VYDGLSKKENLTMKFASNKWFFLKNDYDEEDVSNFRYAFTGFDDIKPANYSWQFYDSTDSEYLLSYLNSNDAGLSSSFEPYTSKITYDFNNDGKEETIYTTTNVNLSEDVKKKFSGIFMVSDKKITNIESNSDSPYQVREILDLDNDNEYEMIVSKGTIDVPTFDACYQIYKLQDNKWNIIKDCD